MPGSRSARRRGGRRLVGLAVLPLLVLSACGEVRPLADSPHEAVSSVPTGTETAVPGAAAGVTPTTSPPPTTTAPPGDGSGGSGATTLSGGAPTRSTFGMHVNQLNSAAWPDLPVGAFRILNADSTWGSLEPEPGVWDFRRLDDRVEQARARGASVLLVLSHPPVWAASRPDLQSFGGSPSPPRSMEDWRRYVSTVASRYAGRIEAYEVWNEPNLPQFFTGSPQQLGELTRVASAAIRAADPSAKVVSAGFSARTGGADSYFRSYVATGIASAIDVVGIHIYPYPGNGPESMIGLARRFRSLANQAGLSSKPMWNTEIGYGRTPDYVVPEAQAASLILRTYLVLPATGLVRNYWYKWDDREFVGLYLVGSDLRSPTSSATRYAEAQRWLVGAQVDRCTGQSNLWTCTLEHADGGTVTVAWSLSGNVPVAVPSGTSVVYTFGGGSQAVSGGQFTVGVTPVLFAPTSLPTLS